MSDLELLVTSPGFDVRGTHLVAASAGTGKTYTIQSLYLRMILEGLTVQQILVVTFTEAATRELRERLRGVLREALTRLENPRPEESDEDRIGKLLRLTSGDPARGQQARTALRLAVLDFDLAAIHTIHGFCLRALVRFAFETGQSFEMPPVSGSTRDIDRLCEDWWRTNLYSASPAKAALVSRSGVKPSTHQRLARRLIAKPDALPSPAPLRLSELSERIRSSLHPILEASGDPGEIQPPAHLCSEGRRAWQELRVSLVRIREAAGRDDWEEAEWRLCQAAELHWKGTPWNLPFDGKAVQAACAEFAAAIRQKRAFTLENGRLTGNGLDTTACQNALRRTMEPLHGKLLEIGDLKRFPHAAASGVHPAYSALLELDAYVRGNAPEAAPVARAIRFLAKTSPDAIPDTPSVDLAAMDPAWADAATALNRALAGLPGGAALEVKRRHEATRCTRETLSFDDYLANLRVALEGERGPALKAALRAEFKAALMDEFQDTDPVQYAIFRAIFPSGSDAPCFLVGDPKQAIYRFRSGDIETYLQATRTITDARRRHQLRTNYRSEARLVEAVNQLFADRPPAAETPPRRTFRHEEMPFDGRLEARGKTPEESLTVQGVRDERPLKLWFFEADEALRLPGRTTTRARSIWKQTAGEIRRLLDDEAMRLGSRRIQPADIAVLVMTHGEAAAIETELIERRIPVVRQGAQSVFRTPEAREFHRVLSSLRDPRDLRALRAALSTSLLGVSWEDLRSLLDGTPCRPPPGWSIPTAHATAPERQEECRFEQWVACFEDLQRMWEEKGFAAAFNELVRRSGLRARLAGLPRGERKLTNLLHLAELAQCASIEQHLTPGGLLEWLRRLLASEDRGSEEAFELRLETDDNAVAILTVFKSKGLQFPIVFAPTLWRRSAHSGFRDGFREYHDAAGLLRVTTDENEGRQESIEEQLQEDVRLVYVALTRAIHRTVLVWGNFKARPEQHALAWLLGSGSGVAALRERFHGDSPVEILECSWDAAQDDAPVPLATPGSDRSCADLRLPPAPFVEKRFGQASFSSLAPHTGTETGEDADRDAVAAEGRPTEPGEGPVDPIFAFPAGARTGTCWHAIFEHLPFDAGDALIRETASEQLHTCGLLQGLAASETGERLRATMSMVSNVLGLPLPPFEDGERPFALREIADGDRRNEWEFSFPAASWQDSGPARTSSVLSLLRSAWRNLPERAAFLERIQSWDRPIPGGYLTGFIDVLFRRKGRYYILDWKSNARGGRASDFEADGLREEMARHAYFLQYLLYTVAVHQYLRFAVPGYEYDRHFGGVYYVFLRGATGTLSHGVYADRPARELVEALASVLGDFS